MKFKLLIFLDLYYLSQLEHIAQTGEYHNSEDLETKVSIVKT